MPAWINPLRLTSIPDALRRINAICTHLNDCVTSSVGKPKVDVTECDGVEPDNHDRGEVLRCTRHAELIARALEWANADDEAASATVIECHAAQSSGGADLVLYKDGTAWLFEASAGTGINVVHKHKDDVRTLNREGEALRAGDRVQRVLKFRVVPSAVVPSLPPAARDSAKPLSDEASLIRVVNRSRSVTSSELEA